MDYTFEKVAGEKLYQVRLNGIFVAYVEDKDSKMVDDQLKEHGWNTREEFFTAMTGK